MKKEDIKAELRDFFYQRSFKTKAQCLTFARAADITDYEIKNTSFERMYQGRIAKSSRFKIRYNRKLS